MKQLDFDALARSGDTARWREAVDGAFALSDESEREAALRTLRSAYEERLAPQFQAVPWGQRSRSTPSFGLHTRRQRD